MIIEEFDPQSRRHQIYADDMPVLLTADTAGLVACKTDLSIMGAILFQQFYPNSANACYQIDNPMCLRIPGLLSEAGTLAFDTWRLKMLFCTIEDNNSDARELAPKIGWRKVAHVPKAVDDKVGLGFYRMRDTDFKNTRYYLGKAREAA